MLGPIIDCDQGYGKKAIMEILTEKKIKVVTIAGNMSSRYPIFGSSVVYFLTFGKIL
jgi:hypothetical protein